MKTTTIKVSVKTRNTLKDMGSMGDSYDIVIRRLIEFWRENHEGGAAG